MRRAFTLIRSPARTAAGLVAGTGAFAARGAPANESATAPPTSPRTTVEQLHHGPNDAVIGAYVDQIMRRTPELSGSYYPHSVLVPIYQNCVRIVLRIIYGGLGNLHGIKLLNHAIVLRLEEQSSASFAPPDERRQHDLRLTNVVNDQHLAAVVDRLLANDRVNQCWIPDCMERPLYTNCLRVVFHLLADFLGTLTFNLLGHELVLTLQPRERPPPARRGGNGSAAESHAHTVSRVSDAVLDQLVQALLETSTKNSPFVPDSVERAFYRDLYRLLLCLVEEILGEVDIDMLGANVTLGVVAVAESAGVVPRQRPMQPGHQGAVQPAVATAAQAQVLQVEPRAEPAAGAGARAHTSADTSLSSSPSSPSPSSEAAPEAEAELRARLRQLRAIEASIAVQKQEAKLLAQGLRAREVHIAAQKQEAKAALARLTGEISLLDRLTAADYDDAESTGSTTGHDGVSVNFM
jgi:hypothetical protein